MNGEEYYNLFNSWKTYLEQNDSPKNTEFSKGDMEWLELILKDSKKRFENEIKFCLRDIEKLEQYDYMENRRNYAKRAIKSAKLKINVVENLLNKYF